MADRIAQEVIDLRLGEDVVDETDRRAGKEVLRACEGLDDLAILIEVIRAEALTGAIAKAQLPQHLHRRKGDGAVRLRRGGLHRRGKLDWINAVRAIRAPQRRGATAECIQRNHGEIGVKSDGVIAQGNILAQACAHQARSRAIPICVIIRVRFRGDQIDTAWRPLEGDGIPIQPNATSAGTGQCRWDVICRPHDQIDQSQNFGGTKGNAVNIARAVVFPRVQEPFVLQYHLILTISN